MYRGSGTLGGKLGCLVAAVLGVPAFLVLGAMIALSGTDGMSGQEEYLYIGLTLLFIIALVPIGLAVRLLVNRLLQGRTN